LALDCPVCEATIVAPLSEGNISMEFFFEIYDVPSRTDMGNDAAGAWVLKGWSNVWLATVVRPSQV
jgi:hypothetical protein